MKWLDKIGQDNEYIALVSCDDFFMIFYHYEPDVGVFVALKSDSTESFGKKIWDGIKEKYGKDIPSIRSVLFRFPKEYVGMNSPSSMWTIKLDSDQFESIIS